MGGNSQTIEMLIDVLCNRWSQMVMYAMESSSDCAMRFKDIREKSGCTSDKMLDKALTELCDDGLVKKNFYPENPHRPDYQITERGKSFLVILKQMRDWVYANERDIMADRMESIEMREKYDK